MRQIDWDAPLSEEDKKWVEAYGTGAMRRAVERNKRRFADVRSAASEEDDDEDDATDEYDSMNLDQLKEFAKARKIDHPDFDTTGVKNKRELVERLREWDADQQSEEE